MEPVLILKTSLVVLSIAAMGGVLMAGFRFVRNINPPSWLAMLHGLLAGSALTLLLYAYFTVGMPAFASWALLLLLVAAAGGAFLNLNYHAKSLPLPKNIVLIHGAMAAMGYVLLLVAVFGPR